MNDSISYSELRQKLKTCLDRVCEDRRPLHVERKNGEDVVIISREDFDALEETSYLLSSPKNANRLQESLTSTEEVTFDSIGQLKNETGL
jgi:antitoxin YefM